MSKIPANLPGSRKNISGYSELSETVQQLSLENERLAENYAAIARATLEFDEVGWSPINQLNQNQGVSLVDVKQIAANARMQMNNNAVLNRGAALRASYVFGRGFKMSSGNMPLQPRFQSIIDDPINQQVLFSEAACKKNEKVLFSSGNFFARYDFKNRRWARIPVEQITGWVVDRNDSEILTYVLHEFDRVVSVNVDGSQQTEHVKVWYPLDYTQNVVSKINDVRVDKNFVIVDHRANDDTGSLWGLPDCLPALPWAWAYSEYLKDGSKMLKALSSIAWQVKSKTKNGQASSSAKLLNNRQVAGTAVTGSDVELSAMPRNNAVDLDTGRPLAAMAATAMEVSVDALLSGAGTTASGSQVLDQSTLNAAYGRQGNWETFFTRVLRVMGVRDPSVKFNKIIVDPGYRNVQSLGQAWQTGLFDPAIIQAAYAEELGIEERGLIPEGVLVPNNEHSMAQASGSNGAGTTPGSDTVGMTDVSTGQGRSGAGVGDLSNGDNTLRDQANIPQ
jgi:hypothetical protein